MRERMDETTARRKCVIQVLRPSSEKKSSRKTQAVAAGETNSFELSSHGRVLLITVVASQNFTNVRNFVHVRSLHAAP